MEWCPVTGYGYNTAIRRSKLPFNLSQDVDWRDMNGPCKEIKFVQKMPVSNSNCPLHTKFEFENRLCIGVCPNVFEPNLVKSNKFVANRCAMCKPHALTVTALLKCNNKTIKEQVQIVKSCECRYVNCECPLRKIS